MLLKTESFNQLRQDKENLSKNYKQMAQIAHDRNVQVASLGALANEVTALYGLRQSKLAKPAAASAAAAEPTPVSIALTDDPDQQQVKLSVDQFYQLRSQALSGRISRALESGLAPNFAGDWTELADAPSLWPLEGRIGSSFGERQDPINGEGAFHSGIDIDAPVGSPVRAAADGNVTEAAMANGYGRQVRINHGHDVVTVYAHLSAMAVVPGQHVIRGQVIGNVGLSGRVTGPNLHYEVRVHNVPVNPYKYLRTTYAQLAFNEPGGAASQAN
jgi:murein DD-endopeptidase MepM/ murein hydrolase activator NlpD